MSLETPSPETQDNLEPEVGEWFKTLPVDYQSEKTLEKFKTAPTPEPVVKSYMDLEKKLGNAVWVPGENPKPEEVSDFRRKLGIPESPDKYEIKYKEHEALKYDENTDKTFKALAHEIGLTPKQAQRLADFDADRFIAAHTAHGKTYEAAAEEIKKEFGNNWEVALDTANNVLRTFADEKDMEAIQNYKNDVRLVRLLNKVGNAMSEHKFVKGDISTNTDTKAELLNEAETLLRVVSDQSKDASERRAANAKAQAIFARVYGSKEVSGSSELEKA